MVDRTVFCPNGCDPEQLEREYVEGFWIGTPGLAGSVWNAPSAEYHCLECDWTANWTHKVGLRVTHSGGRRSAGEDLIGMLGDPDGSPDEADRWVLEREELRPRYPD